MNRCVSVATPQKSKSDLIWAKLSVKIPFFLSEQFKISKMLLSN